MQVLTLKVTERPILGMNLVCLVPMYGFSDVAEAIAAYPAEPSDTVEFAGWFPSPLDF
jgi:hypothetical protein